jgi:hypothetical protein
MAVEEAIAKNAHVQGRKAAEEAVALQANPPPCANQAPAVTPSALPAVDFWMPWEKGIPAHDVPPPIPHFLAMDQSAGKPGEIFGH